MKQNVLIGGHKPFDQARPGEIGLVSNARVTPRPNLKYLGLPCGTRKTFTIRGDKIACVHLQNGIFIRLDDFIDLKLSITQFFRSSAEASSIPEPSISLAIRALWEGQSFINIISFRGGNTERCAPYHERRIEAVQCKLFFCAYIYNMYYIHHVHSDIP